MLSGARASGLSLLGLACLLPACGYDREPSGPYPTSRDDPRMTADSPRMAELARIVASHAEALMAIPGVTGVAVGLLPDGETPCLQILVTRQTDELEALLPRTVEGHPVVIVESGEIRPLEGH